MGWQSGWGIVCVECSCWGAGKEKIVWEKLFACVNVRFLFFFFIFFFLFFGLCFWVAWGRLVLVFSFLCDFLFQILSL